MVLEVTLFEIGHNNSICNIIKTENGISFRLFQTIPVLIASPQVRRLCDGDPIFTIFDPIGSLFYASSYCDWHHFYSEIFGLKVGLIFHQNYIIEVYLLLFSLIFDAIDPFFHWF